MKWFLFEPKNGSGVGLVPETKIELITSAPSGSRMILWNWRHLPPADLGLSLTEVARRIAATPDGGVVDLRQEPAQ